MAGDDTHREIRDAVARLCADFPPDYWRQLDAERQYPTDFVAALTNAGFLGALIPAEYGGAGLPLSAAAAILEAIHHAGADGAPAAPLAARRLSDRPHVRLFPGLLTPAECAHVASVGADLLEPSMIVDPATGKARPDPVRTSDAAVIGPAREDLVIRAINRRIAAASGTAVDAGEPLTVLRYAPGQQYRPHHDALPGAANQRQWTMLVYLNQGYGGGETVFPATGLSVKGRGGDGLLFANLDADGGIDAMAQHAGLAVTAGAKWLCTRWIRQQPYDPWAPS